MSEISEARNDELVAATRRVMVDFNQMKAFSADPLVKEDGKGFTHTDLKGRLFNDGLSGVFAVSLGHGYEEIISSITAQLRRLSFSSPFMTTSDRALDLAG